MSETINISRDELEVQKEDRVRRRPLRVTSYVLGRLRRRYWLQAETVISYRQRLVAGMRLLVTCNRLLFVTCNGGCM